MIASLPMRRIAAPVLSLCFVAGIWADHQLFHLPAGDAAAYHARVRGVAERLPYRVGDWAGTDVEPPQSAVAILRPNLIQGREYRNSSTGEHVTLLIVQCRDARDMSGHWPPICYPAHGWTLRDTERKQLVVPNATIPVTVYRFTIESIDRYSELVVYNFFVRPDGRIEGDRTGVNEASKDPRMKVFGAAQFQIAFDSSVAPDRRDGVAATLMSGVFPVIDVIRGGVSP